MKNSWKKFRHYIGNNDSLFKYKPYRSILSSEKIEPIDTGVKKDSIKYMYIKEFIKDNLGINSIRFINFRKAFNNYLLNYCKDYLKDSEYNLYKEEFLLKDKYNRKRIKEIKFIYDNFLDYDSLLGEEIFKLDSQLYVRTNLAPTINKLNDRFMKAFLTGFYKKIN